ncbi:MAG: hypothetical protein H6622_06050 [Halobacteriovoraceae bacterium]|nr:hypothetical protein [Halobacteriovoraceae bacterium]
MRIFFWLSYSFTVFSLKAVPIETQSDVLIHNITHRVNVRKIALVLFDELLKYPEGHSFLIEKYQLKHLTKTQISRLRQRVDQIVSLHDIEKVQRENVAGIYSNWGKQASSDFKEKLNNHGNHIISKKLSKISPTKQELKLSQMLETFADQIDRYKNPISPFEFGRKMSHPVQYAQETNATDEISQLLRHKQGRELLEFGIKSYEKTAKVFNKQKELISQKLNHLNYLGIDQRTLDPIESIKFAYAIADYNKNLLIQIFDHAHTEFFEAAKHSKEGQMVYYHTLYKYKLYLAKQANSSLRNKFKRFLSNTSKGYFKLFREIELMEISCI